MGIKRGGFCKQKQQQLQTFQFHKQKRPGSGGQFRQFDELRVKLFAPSVVKLFAPSVVKLFAPSVVKLFAPSVVKFFTPSVVFFRFVEQTELAATGAGKLGCMARNQGSGRARPSPRRKSEAVFFPRLYL